MPGTLFLWVAIINMFAWSPSDHLHVCDVQSGGHTGSGEHNMPGTLFLSFHYVCLISTVSITLYFPYRWQSILRCQHSCAHSHICSHVLQLLSQVLLTVEYVVLMSYWGRLGHEGQLVSTAATRAQSDTELSKHCPCPPLNLFHYTCLHHSMVMHRQVVSCSLWEVKSKQKRLLCVYEKSWFKESPVCINNESIVTVI